MQKKLIMKKEEVEKIHQNLSPLPIVTFDFPIKNCAIISVDNYQGIEKLLTHFIKDHGFSKFALITCRKEYSNLEKLESYKSILSKNGISYNTALIFFR